MFFFLQIWVRQHDLERRGGFVGADLKLRGRGYVLVRGRVVSLAMGRAGKGSFTKKGLSDGPC